MENLAGNDVLAMWTVYDHPRDYPEHFVARRHFVGRGVSWPDEQGFVLADSLDQIRRLMMRQGLVCLDREPEDDPKIVEVWL